jgi:transcriptional regulator
MLKKGVVALIERVMNRPAHAKIKIKPSSIKMYVLHNEVGTATRNVDKKENTVYILSCSL